jgi:hypothetical protein
MILKSIPFSYLNLIIYKCPGQERFLRGVLVYIDKSSMITSMVPFFDYSWTQSQEYRTLTDRWTGVCSLGGRYDSPIPTRLTLARIDCLKIPALTIGSSTFSQFAKIWSVSRFQ